MLDIKQSLNIPQTITPEKPLYKEELKIDILGAEEIAQRLRVPTALPEVLSSIPSNHMVAHNHPL